MLIYYSERLVLICNQFINRQKRKKNITNESK